MTALTKFDLTDLEDQYVRVGEGSYICPNTGEEYKLVPGVGCMSDDGTVRTVIVGRNALRFNNIGCRFMNAGVDENVELAVLMRPRRSVEASAEVVCVIVNSARHLFRNTDFHRFPVMVERR